MTESETALWSKIRKRQVNGYRFRRQYSVGSYVIDFYCPELHLAVEIDGPSHDSSESRECDTRRTEEISGLGITIMRF